MSNLETTYLGLKLKNPLVAASSGLTSSVDKIKELEAAGIGAVVLKSIFEEQINNEVSSMLAKDQQNMDYPEAEDYIKGYLRDNTIRKHIELIEEAKKKLLIFRLLQVLIVFLPVNGQLLQQIFRKPEQTHWS